VCAWRLPPRLLLLLLLPPRSETELPEALPFSAADVCELLRLDRQPALLQAVQQLMPSEGAGRVLSCKLLACSRAPACVTEHAGCRCSCWPWQHVALAGCLALALLRGLSALTTSSSRSISLITGTSSSSGSGIDAACQTTTAGQLDGLNRRLLLLEDSYLSKVCVLRAVLYCVLCCVLRVMHVGRSWHLTSPQLNVTAPHTVHTALHPLQTHKGASSLSTLALEEHMAAYRQECDALLEVQVAARVARALEVEVAAARQQAAARYNAQLNAERSELERVHNERLTRLAAREEEVCVCVLREHAWPLFGASRTSNSPRPPRNPDRRLWSARAGNSGSWSQQRTHSAR
jgi:hypothetical protein